MEADLKVKKPTAPLKDTKQNLIGSPDITLPNNNARCKVCPVSMFHARMHALVVRRAKRDISSASDCVVLRSRVPGDWQCIVTSVVGKVRFVFQETDPAGTVVASVTYDKASGPSAGNQPTHSIDFHLSWHIYDVNISLEHTLLKF